MADSKKHRDGRTDKQTLASYSFMLANLKAKNRIAVRCRPDFAPQLTIIFSMVEGEAPSAMALQSRAPADLPCRSNGDFMPREEQTSDPLSSRASQECSWPTLRPRTEAEVRSETPLDHGGAPHRANLPS